MVCKRSLYCWKNGPCASDEARKRIWEDNIRFRENLRDINQSDHYWSFQISKNSCLCLVGENILHNRPLSRKHLAGSLQNLNDIDCASITHDFNGLKFRNCYIHCPIHNAGKDDKETDAPIPQSLVTKHNVATSTREPVRLFGLLHKTNENKPEYCRKYKNTSSHSNLKPATKIKFSSQMNLINPSKSIGTSQKKSLHSSCQDLLITSQTSQCNSPRAQHECNPKSNLESKESHAAIESKARKDKMKFKISSKELNPVVICPSEKNFHKYTPISRTTRKMLCLNKKVPFATFGCNNNNIDIGNKKTHNVLASKLEVYPNALAANRKKRDLLLKYMQSEREFQKKCLPENLKNRVINHSSLWSIEYDGKENKSSPCKNTRHVLPAMSKQQKRPNRIVSNKDSFPYKTC